MLDFSEIMLLGYLGGDPEVRSTSNGTMVATFSLGTSTNGKDNEPSWYKIVVWERGAEAAKRLRKGMRLFVRGQSKTRSYEDKQGNKRYVNEIHLSDKNWQHGIEKIDTAFWKTENSGEPKNAAEEVIEGVEDLF